MIDIEKIRISYGPATRILISDTGGIGTDEPTRMPTDPERQELEEALGAKKNYTKLAGEINRIARIVSDSPKPSDESGVVDVLAEVKKMAVRAWAWGLFKQQTKEVLAAPLEDFPKKLAEEMHGHARTNKGLIKLFEEQARAELAKQGGEEEP